MPGVAMSTAIELPDNVARVSSATRCWNGMTVERNEYTCTGRILIRLKRPQEFTWLGAQLEEVGQGYVEARFSRDIPNPRPYKARPLYIVPADMELWAHSADARYLKWATVTFDSALLQERLHISDSLRVIDTQRFRFSDDRLWMLMKLLAEEVENGDSTTQLYGDSLTAALAAKLFERPGEATGSDYKLSARQLKDTISYLEAKMPAKVELSALAQLADLSQSHFCRAFKASTGLAPYQWQLQARVDRAKDLLLNTNGRLQDVAEATGFSDAVHFGRTFRKVTGATPAAWRMDKMA